jgi:hypothetical protein
MYHQQGSYAISFSALDFVVVPILHTDRTYELCTELKKNIIIINNNNWSFA